MFGSQHFINPNRYPKAADLSLGNYPIALSQDKFLDLFNDVKSFSFNGFATIDNTLSQNIAASSITEGLQDLNNANNSAQSAAFAGSSKRKIVPIGQLKSTGEESSLATIPSSLIDYPVHSAGGSGGLMTIDFGYTLTIGNLFYPKITILFSNGMGSAASCIIVGSITFENYGSIPIYGGPAVDGITLGFAGGQISIKERYSSLRADSNEIQDGGSIVLSAANDSISNLAAYTMAYFGAASSLIGSNGRNLNIKVPINAKSGPIRITSNDPLDSFLTYDSFRII